MVASPGRAAELQFCLTLGVMLKRLWHQLKFEIEGFLLRGALNRLLFIAMAIAAISVIGGALVYHGASQFTDPNDAVWWAFLRLSDPGYLGDDEGTFVRTVSTILTVLGYVVFLGALVAIMTQWLNQTLSRLQSGLTPIAETNHIVILGWNGRVTTIVQELLLSEERVRRFLVAHREGALRIAILAEQVDPALVQELRDQLGKLFDARKIILRTGTPLRIEHLRRVDYAHAAAVLLPRPDLGSSLNDPDERTLKVLLSISAAREAGDELPLLVAEISDARKTRIARRAYAGPIEVIPVDRMFARLIVQTLRNPGLSEVFAELLTHRTGTEIYVRQAGADLVGSTWGEAITRYEHTLPIGVVRPGNPNDAVLLPPWDYPIEPGDRIAVIAESWRSAGPAKGERPFRRLTRTSGALPPVGDVGRILIIGWNDKVPAILQELSSLGNGASSHCAVDIISRREAGEREARIRRSGVELGTLNLRNLEMPGFAPHDLEQLGPAEYDHVVLMASDRFDEEDESDARTIVSSLVLDQSCGDAPLPHVVIELLDPDNEPLLRAPHREIFVSPLMMGHIMAQVALRPELSSVFDDLFGPGGAGIEYHSAQSFAISGRELEWRDIASRVDELGGLLLGWRTSAGLQLNPRHDSRVALSADDQLVVLRS